MLDQPDQRGASGKTKGPALDFQQHLAALEAAGLVEHECYFLLFCHASMIGLAWRKQSTPQGMPQ